ncbi:MAG TPA: TetR/AcrR family transcriptional regulator [Streptosporangiaceae bacterium]|nr:TetR/AcrR family transcriptional regulator [Streptosporangiaceae bacterium]
MTATASASRTARERARAELTREIKEEARRQLAASGAQGLSLRAVARALGMVSSAVYRYFPSRDELLTALIIDAYDAIGATAEAAVARPRAAGVTGRQAAGVTGRQAAGVTGRQAAGVTGRQAAGVTGRRAAGVTGRRAARARSRWTAACHAIRNWALAHPHEYALIYGSPVPGYQAPQATVASAIRVFQVLGGILADAWRETGEGTGGTGGARGEAGDARGEAGGTRGEAGDARGGARGQRSGGIPGPAAQPVPPELAAQTAIIADAIAPGVPAAMIARALVAWTQLFGMVSFELFGQFVGTVEPADEFFGYALAQMADYIGLP